MRVGDIRAMVKDFGKGGFVRVFADLLEGRDQQGKEVPKINKDKISIQALWEGLVGPMDETLDIANRGGSRFSYVDSVSEAVESTAFPSAVGVLIASKVIEGYDQPGYIGDSLVTNMPSKLKSERIVGFTALEGPQEVAEGAPYVESGFTEKYVTTETAKKGRILEITEETVFFDQTGQIMMRAQRLGEQTRLEREEIIIAGVLDVGGSAGVGPYKPVYRPGGAASALYSHASFQNNLAVATPLVDWTDIDEALRYHADNVRDDRAVAGEQRPIVFMPKIILTARRLAGTAARILNAMEHRSQPGAADATNVLITGNPLANIAPGLRAVTSPLIDFLATVSGSNYSSPTHWFIGDPARQFIWQEIWPVQTFRAPSSDDAQFRRDIVARFKVRYYGGIAAIDTKYFLKINGV